MPARLRPTAPIAADAILVGDPGRALMLAQELLRQPKMSNHARGLWGYSGVTPSGHELTIQATGMGGPSAAVVLGDLAELGVRRVIRIGTCASLGDLPLGELLVVAEARTATGDHALPHPELTAALAQELEATPGVVLSLDSLGRPEPGAASMSAEGLDMQTAALLRTARERTVVAAVVLIAVEVGDSEQLGDAELEDAVKRAGKAAAVLLSP
jgi:purine-nucleoside phosphorylase